MRGILYYLVNMLQGWSDNAFLISSFFFKVATKLLNLFIKYENISNLHKYPLLQEGYVNLYSIYFYMSKKYKFSSPQ